MDALKFPPKREERQQKKKDSNEVTGVWSAIWVVWIRASAGPERSRRNPDGQSEARLLLGVQQCQENYSSGSGCKLKSFSPAAFFSAYFFIQASQLLPAAVSRPENDSAPISAYDIEIFSFEFFG